MQWPLEVQHILATTAWNCKQSSPDRMAEFAMSSFSVMPQGKTPPRGTPTRRYCRACLMTPSTELLLPSWIVTRNPSAWKDQSYLIIEMVRRYVATCTNSKNSLRNIVSHDTIHGNWKQ